MIVINKLDARICLPQLVEAVESGAEDEIVIARSGKPAARVVPISPEPAAGKRLGLLRGRYPDMSLEDFNSQDENVADMFVGERRLRLTFNASLASFLTRT